MIPRAGWHYDPQRMRIKTTFHNALFRAFVCAALVGFSHAGSGQVRASGGPASLSVVADSASEDQDSRALLIEGSVRVSGQDWEFTAERATLEGTLDEAEQIHAQGSPARIFFRNIGGQSEIGEVEGVARDIRYRRHEDILQLKGDASLRRDANTLASEEIQYRRENDLFKAGGAGGVRLTITPGPRRPAAVSPLR